ncbi:MAG: tryptophan--tRNA ligase [Candidatus Komeilibacteria bacterium]|nr:tryptophan--tRNA ligase [Candidatus Komeilibacteria bacterium]
MQKRVLSGIRTTGPLHIGHYFGALQNWLELQDNYDCYFLLADVQALTTHFDRAAEIEQSVREVVLDLLAVGIDPAKATIFIQSQIPELAELSMYFGMFTRLSELLQNPTIKDELKKQKDEYYGFIGYPVSQAADILLFSPLLTDDNVLLIPVGEDQAPHIQSTRKVARRFNEMYKPVFVLPEIMISDTPRLPGLDMEKMGKSAGNAIFLKDSPADIARKVNNAFTDPKKIRRNDPGNPYGCAIFQFYRAFGDNKLIIDVELGCKAGKIGCVQDKQRMTELVIEFLRPIQERRAFFEKRPDLVAEILNEGNKRAKVSAQGIMDKVRDAMHINYNFLKE